MACPLTPLMSALEDLKSQELKKFRMYLSEGVMEGFARMPRGKLQEDSDATDIADLMTKMYGGENSLKITLHILRVIKQNEVAARLQGEMERTQINAQGPLSQLDVSPSDKRNEYDDLQKVKTAIQTDLRSKFGNISECVSTQGQAKYLNEIFVDLYITEGGSGDINDQHEVRQIEATRKRDRDTPIRCADLFRCLPEQKRQITSVLTKGIAGIGKTISVQKFILDWAEQKANEDIAIVVPLPFRDLNLKKEHYSLMDLLYIYAPQLKEMKNLESVHNKVLLIMDGLDECRHILDFQNSPWWSDVSKPTSVGVLLTNLIKGNLLPSAMKWITSRPAAASQIPSEYVHRVTEVRGFSDDQKEEYFRKKISNESMANKIITHMKTSTTLYIMCHIPIFCLISALVFDSMFSDAKPGELPQTLTEMYIHFLIIQTCMKNRKYHGNAPNLKDPLSNSDKGMVLKLGELAYKQLNKGHLIFYEEDLQGCGIDVKKASEYSSLCTEIFREEKGLYQERVFCFVHLSIQEFLAAVYVHVSCVQKNVNVLSLHSDRMDKDTVSLSDVHKKAVEIALLSPNGHLDLFLRFLLGLSREDKQTFLPEATTKRSGLRRLMNAFLKPNPSHKIDTDLTLCVNETIQCIRKEIRRVQAPERTINLFHCLSELKDDSLVKGILNEVSSGTLSHTNMEPDKCSALTYAVLMSGNVLEVFDLNKFRTSAAGQERLLCMLKACKHGRLAGSKITAESCQIVASALRSEKSPLTDLELSNNDIGNKGVAFLCTGLTSPHCNLAKLRLDGCSLSAESCKSVASALQSDTLPLTELVLSYNSIGDNGVMFLCSGLSSSHCKLTKLSLAKCALTKDACGYVASALKANSTLTKLELSHNDVTDLGVEMLCDGLMSAQCRLSSLRLAACHLTYESCTSLANALQGEESSLRELNLNYNDLGDLGVKLLCDGNQCINANSKIQMLKLSECSLTEDSCEYLAYVLQSPSSNLKNLQLRDNDLQDTGVMLLSAGIKHANCRLQSLGLAGCGIKEDGFYSLAHALDCNPLHLEQLCLNFNNPRAQGIVSLFDQKSDPKYKLDTLILDSSEAFQLNPGPRKYFCPLTLDDRVPHDMDFISLRDKSVSTGSSMDASQYEIMLSKEALTKRCYWEVEVSGDRVEIGVSSRAQKSRRADDQMGQSGFFPCLVIYLNKLHGFLQNGEIMADCPDLDCPQRIGLYLNKNAECLSFYSVCEDKLTLLAKFPSTGFTKVTSAGKLFAACRIYSNSEAKLIS